MVAWAINDRIYFDMAIIRAKWLYNRKRKMECKSFKVIMRKAAKWGKPHEHRNFKRTGRARP